MKITIDEINWIFENEFKIHPEFPLEEQLDQFLLYLGSPDSLIREKSLSILGTWTEKDLLTDEQLIDMAEKTSESILIGLGEKNTDSVFLRSFSALILANIIDLDEAFAQQIIEDRKPFLTEALIEKYLDASLKYYREEKDIRGYVEEKEWAHSIAHGADLFRKLAKHRLLGKEELLRILEVFKMKIIEPQDDTYKAREELRITVAVYTLFLRRLLNTEEIIEWFSGFEGFITEKVWYELVKEPNKLNALLNLQMFLKDMYLMVKHGISNKGYFDQPIYQDNQLENKNEICKAVESLLLLFAKNTFFIED